MPDEFDKPTENADTDEYGEDAEAPILPQPTETSANEYNAGDKTKRAQRNISAAFHGVRWFFLKLWIVLKSASFWTALATVVIAVSTIFYTIYARKQWQEIKAGSADTHALAEAAKTQAEKMKSMSDAAEKIRQAAEDMVAQDRRIADNAQKALDASNKQSKASLDASVAASRNDQRAWVGASDPTISGLELDAFPKAQITWTNSGKTFAKHVLPSAHLRFSTQMIATEKELDTLAESGITPPETSIGVLAPQAKAQKSSHESDKGYC